MLRETKLSRRKERQRERAEHASAGPLFARTANQQRYIDSINRNILTFGTGPAGTGKTFISATIAAHRMSMRRIGRVILTRPAVEAGGEKHGFLPGNLEKKMDPWIAPLMDIFQEHLGSDRVRKLMFEKAIDVIPFTYMRGRTFNNAFVLLDEAQNTTPEQMELFLTRIGEDCVIVVNGDVKQSDLKRRSGLNVAVELIKSRKIKCGLIEFGLEDVVRSELCKEWASAFDWWKEKDGE